jgi:hypothetical protein
MMKNNIILIISSAFIILLTGACSSTKKNVRTTPFSASEVRLELNASDFNYLGKTEVTYTYRRFFLIFRKLDSLNNQQNHPRVKRIVKFNGIKNISLNRFGKQAAIKATKKFPEADYYVPVNEKKEVEKKFLGRKIKTSIIIKAYKLKHE